MGIAERLRSVEPKFDKKVVHNEYSYTTPDGAVTARLSELLQNQTPIAIIDEAKKKILL